MMMMMVMMNYYGTITGSVLATREIQYFALLVSKLLPLLTYLANDSNFTSLMYLLTSILGPHLG